MWVGSSYLYFPKTQDTFWGWALICQTTITMNTDLVIGTVHTAQNTDSEVTMGGCSWNRFSWHGISRGSTHSDPSRFCSCSYTGHIWVSVQHATASTASLHHINHQECFQLWTTPCCPCQDTHTHLPTEDFRASEGVSVQTEGTPGMECWAAAANIWWVQQQNMVTPSIKAWTEKAYMKMQICGRLVDGFYVNSAQLNWLLMIANILNIINGTKSNKLKFNLTSILSDVSSYCLSCHDMVFLNSMLDVMPKPWDRHWSRSPLTLWVMRVWQGTQGSIPCRGTGTLLFIKPCSRTVLGFTQLPNQLGSALGLSKI